MHGCYNPDIGNSKYYMWPLESGLVFSPTQPVDIYLFSSRLYGCDDESVNLDHRDSSHPIYNYIKSTHEMRKNYVVFQDGFSLQLLSNQTHQIFLPGSGGTSTETGLWSIERAGLASVQHNLTQSAWLVYTNENHTTRNEFDCFDRSKALIAPFAAGSTVKNTYYPYEEYTLKESLVKMSKILPLSSEVSQIFPEQKAIKLIYPNRRNLGRVERLFVTARTSSMGFQSFRAQN